MLILEFIIYIILFNLLFICRIIPFGNIICNLIFGFLESVCRNFFKILFKRFVINIINILFLSWFIDINIIKEIIYNNIDVKSPVKINENEMDEVALRHRRRCQQIEERLKQVEKENKYAMIAGAITILILIIGIFATDHRIRD